MMDKALTFLSNCLNQGIKNQLSLGEDKTIVGRLVNPDGTIPMEVENKLVLNFIRLELDGTREFYNSKVGFASGKHADANSMLHVNLDVLLASNFSNENEALKFLSIVLSFFQTYPIFTRSTHPDMPSELDKISLEINDLSLSEIDSLWSSIGSKALPSILYKVRLIVTPMGLNDGFEA